MTEQNKEAFLRECARKPREAFSGEGLTDQQAEAQRKRTGEGRKQHFLRRAFLNPFSVVLLVLAAISGIVDVGLAPAGERNFTTVTIISIMLLVSGCIRLLQELHSKKITDRLLRLVDAPVRVRRNGIWCKREARELALGDHVRLSAGERVPADIRLLWARDCFLSESAITGESEASEKTPEPGKDPPETLRDYRNIAFCGTTVLNGHLEGVVIGVGKGTLYGELLPKGRKRGYDQGANSIAWVLIRFMALLVPIVFVASGLTKGNWATAFFFSLSVAVGLMPELLPMVITACLAKGSYNMSQQQTVVKSVNAMQAFGNMDVLCLDKTGTLTEDTLLLEYYMDILGNEDRSVLEGAYLNSFFHAGIAHPLDSAILKAGRLPGRDGRKHCLQFEKLDELPFDYTRRMASVLLRGREGSFLLAKGSVDAVLDHCGSAQYRGQKVPMDAEASASVHAIVDEMLEDGMKVLAVAGKTVSGDRITAAEEQNLTLLGYLAFFDAPKKTAASALRKLEAMHVAAKVLTGDHLDVAVSVCRRLGLDAQKTMTGRELDGLSDNEIQMQVEETLIFAELSPAQKERIVEILQSNGHTVGFLADGVNDLPGVLRSDVGISVDTAVPSVQECADVILLKKDLNVLESGITEGRKAFANMSKYVRITASSNLGNIIAIVLASLVLPFFPMTSLQLLLLNLLYDLLCLVLPWDRVDPEMIEKPLEWSGKSLGSFMRSFGPISSVFDVLTFAFLFFWLCPTLCGGAYGGLPPAEQARFVSIFQTGWFLESMWTQVWILQLLRTGKLPFVQSKPSGPVLSVTLLGIVAFTLLAVTPVGRFLGLTSLPPVYFAFLIGTVLLYLLVMTAVKRRYLQRHHSLI